MLQQRVAQDVLTSLKEHPDAWTRVDTILEFSQNQQTKYYALQILETVIKTRWKVLPRAQCEGIFENKHVQDIYVYNHFIYIYLFFVQLMYLKNVMYLTQYIYDAYMLFFLIPSCSWSCRCSNDKYFAECLESILSLI